MCTYKDLQSQTELPVFFDLRPQLSSVLLQILLYFSAFYSLFYFLSSLCIIIYKSQVLSYPDNYLVLDLCLLFLMAAFEILRIYWGMRSNLQESERYVGASLFITGATLLLSVYFLLWQSYVMRADVIVNAILLCIYGLSGVASFGALARFTRFGFRGFDRMTRGLS
ncbi:transmembrane protein 80-like isoform X2 [Silurus meridionalis]|uniref:transmembrane protein 80-like isoform X2 n=1 Tax=Silurus meridionalis TaxID=175797 RepID=UPI001EEA5390|nr:transmembrane protein 80-like isoform X2 [Silurus meridionalis]